MVDELSSAHEESAAGLQNAPEPPETHRPDDRKRSPQGSMIANMDEFDFLALLAEARIMDIAWAQ